MAWQSVSPEVTVNGFKKCCISNAVDDTNGMFWNDSEEDGDVKSECEEDERTLCEDGDSEWHWWVKVDKISHAFCIKCMKLIVKYFLADFYFGGSS